MNPTPSRERICLLTGGGYPYRRDALSGWCRTLVEGLRRYRFELLTVTDREPPAAPAYPLPLNVGSARAVAVGRDSKRPDQRHDQRHEPRRYPCPDQRHDHGHDQCHDQGRESRHDSCQVGHFDDLLKGHHRSWVGEQDHDNDQAGNALENRDDHASGSEARDSRANGSWALDGSGSRDGHANENKARDGHVDGGGAPDGQELGAGEGKGRKNGRTGWRENRQEKREAAERARSAAAMLCGGLIGEAENAELIFADGLRRIAENTAVLPGLPLADALLESWRTGHAREGELPLPRLSVRDARTAATLLRHALGALTVDLPESDLVHCIGGTTPLLTALAGRWRQGIPLLLTEARAPVARHKPHEERLSPAVRTVLRRFRAAVARTGYAEAELIAPLSSYHHSWALRHGARATKLVQVPAGVDPSEYPGAPEPETDPAVVWAGSGGPDSGLSPLLAAFQQVAAAIPGTVLHLVGVTAAHEDYCAEQIERTGLGRAVRLHPLPADPRDRYTAGHVVAHVPGPADPPYRLIEAMMSGRAVVGVDVGPAAETLGDAGVLVQPDDPAELAIAVVGLLRAPGRRRALGEAARRRALMHFTNDRVVRVYGALYADLAARPAPPSFELALAVPAPRNQPPATLRWLVNEARTEPPAPLHPLAGETRTQPPATPHPLAGETRTQPPATPHPPAGEKRTEPQAGERRTEPLAGEKRTDPPATPQRPAGETRPQPPATPRPLVSERQDE
ncbi:DUF3492 domain-containing protein [Paractinoplanes ovalisporus]|uniref:DUF3492 domain-containing protein n=1 Tax=Paractinoplanes ovalisporus TaxID=2810368 RepID=UPI0027DC828F|nr:DUF3492 domain-containing protein [Actinoplanes ovalisporus]